MKRKISTSILIAVFLSVFMTAYSQTRTELTRNPPKWATDKLGKKNFQGLEDWAKKRVAKKDAAERSDPPKIAFPPFKPANEPTHSKIPEFCGKKSAQLRRLSNQWRSKNNHTARIRSRFVTPKPSVARTSAQQDVPAIIRVDYHATAGFADGTTWEDAFLELSDALLYVRDNPGVEQIWVAYGIYWPLYNADYTFVDQYDRNNVFVLPKDVKIYGGFEGTEVTLAERDLKLTESFNTFGTNSDNYMTILSGDLSDDDYFDLPDYTSDNAYHVVLSVGDVGSATLDGLVVAGGNAVEDLASVSIGGYTIPHNSGGGIAAYGSSPTLSNVTISQNTAKKGAAIYASSSNFVMTGALVAGNSVTGSGGIYLSSSSPVITNSTIAGNIGDLDATGILFDGASTLPQIRNTIIYANGSSDFSEVMTINAAAPSFEYCMVRGTGGSGAWHPEFGTDGGHNLDVYPDFFDAERGLFGVQPTSAAINAGNNLYFDSGQSPDLNEILTDLRGITRLNQTAVDMGAFESSYATLTTSLTPTNHILYVTKGGKGLKNGSSWLDAAEEVADALIAAKLNHDVHEIWVSGGKYHPLYRPDDLSNADPVSKLNSFLMVDGLRLYGGFAGTETSLAQRNLSLVANRSILSGDFNEDDHFNLQDFYDSGPQIESEENAFHLIYAIGQIELSASIDGFTIEGTNVASEAIFGDGSILYAYLVINGLEVPVLIGSGIVCVDFPLEMDRIIVRNNFGFYGGGLTTVGTDLTIKSSAVYHNFDFAGGGGILNLEARLNIFNVTVTENLSLYAGGGVASLSSLPTTVFSSIIYGNILLDENDPAVSDFAVEGSDAFNTIGQSLVGGSGGSSNWSFSDVNDFGGNLDEDPVFKDVYSLDFSLSACSRAIDAGENGSYGILSVDVAGNERIFNGVVDMGAFELQTLQSSVTTTLAGNGKESTYEFVDNLPHTFTAESGVCPVDILTLAPTGLAGEVTSKVWYDAEVNSFNNAVYLQRHFDIDPADNAENAAGRVTLYFTQAEFDALNELLTPETFLPTGDPDGETDRIANFRIYQFHGPSSDGSGDPSSYGILRTEIDPADEDVVWNSTSQRWEITFDVEGFSGFFGGTASQSPLPVRLVSFEGKRIDDQKIRLDWKVAEQENIGVYKVEYSENGKTFVEIGEQAANTLSSTEYNYTDAQIHGGVRAYYRLKIVEFDGKMAFSKLISVKLPNSAMAVYPVPAKNELWIDWAKTDASSAELIDAGGRILKTVTKISASQKVDISGLPSGIFLLKTGISNAWKVVKE